VRRRQHPVDAWLHEHLSWWGWCRFHRRHHGCGHIEAYRWAKWNVWNERRHKAIGGNVGDGYATSLRKARERN
jgi:hypothetical protein